jgi:hypothetical protein
MTIILPSKPSVRKPDWATGSSAKIEDPGEAKQEAGWVVDSLAPPYGEKPRFPVVNWLQNSIGQWTDYFDNALDFLASILRKTDYFYAPSYVLNTNDARPFFLFLL